MIGTDYVWTDDSTNDELYVIDVIQGKIVKTISEVESTRLVSVQNFERVRLHDDLLKEMKMMQKGSVSPDSLTVAVIIIGSLVLFVGLVNLYFTSSMKGKKENEKLIAVPRYVIDGMNDVEPTIIGICELKFYSSYQQPTYVVYMREFAMAEPQGIKSNDFNRLVLELIERFSNKKSGIMFFVIDVIII